jgi:hypothetical protein
MFYSNFWTEQIKNFWRLEISLGLEAHQFYRHIFTVCSAEVTQLFFTTNALYSLNESNSTLISNALQGFFIKYDLENILF